MSDTASMPSTAAARPPGAANFRSIRRFYVLAWYGLGMFAGTRVALLPMVELNLDRALQLCLGLLATLLVLTDAKLVGRPLPHTSAWLIWWAWPIAVPACLLSRRGLRGLLTLLLHGTGFLVTTLVGALIVRWSFGLAVV
ncbi:MAG: hypothetical protein R2991_16855 [Thermoanaerobaculia bacterium]